MHYLCAFLRLTLHLVFFSRMFGIVLAAAWLSLLVPSEVGSKCA